ncbi:hypothetical protein [Psychromonas antarctica]|uniref:hypothetical protein n=1 Tax=Psychromonas antarctica TaxID=67573 RepID=UPI003B83556C
MQTQDNHDLSIELNALLANILHSSAIEGEQLNVFFNQRTAIPLCWFFAKIDSKTVFKLIN